MEKEPQMFFKKKRIRLKGKKLQELYLSVWERDGGVCQKCGKWVEPGTIPHHIQFRSQGGGDTLDNLELLCMECHYRRHNGGN